VLTLTGKWRGGPLWANFVIQLCHQSLEFFGLWWGKTAIPLNSRLVVALQCLQLAIDCFQSTHC
jgi:hypothetical protein